MTTLTGLDPSLDFEEFLDAQGEALRRPAMHEAAARALAGPPVTLSNRRWSTLGSRWAIAEQRLIARLLDLDSIGVRVTDSGMRVPQKSASIMVGVGPRYECSEVRSPCDYCDIGETCRYKH